MTALVLVVGNLLGGRTGLIIALVLSLAMNAGNYFWSDKLAFRAKGARPLRPEEAPALHAMVRELAEEAGQPLPRLHISPVAQPNAFATGRNPKHAAVAVTDGILSLLTPRELRAVLAHELSHVYNRDILICSVAANLSLFIPMGGLIRLFISRRREYQADVDGALLSRDPMALASALTKVDHAVRRTPQTADGLAHLMIVKPLADHGLRVLLRSHPPTPNRVRRLHRLARSPTR